MGWETRNGRGCYYTRTIRVGKRFIREYVGTGLLAESAARMDAEDGAQRRAELEALRLLRAENQRIGDELETLAMLSNALAAAVLEGEGFHKHKGQWRRRRKLCPRS